MSIRIRSPAARARGSLELGLPTPRMRRTSAERSGPLRRPRRRAPSDRSFPAATATCSSRRTSRSRQDRPGELVRLGQQAARPARFGRGSRCRGRARSRAAAGRFARAGPGTRRACRPGIEHEQSRRTRRWATTARSPLRHDVGLDAHVEEPADDLAGAAGVKGRQDQMAGERGLKGDLGGGLVADLADRDDLGVLPQAATSGPTRASGPAARLTWAWATPGTTASIGSSSVARLRSPLERAASSRRQA